MDTSESLSQIFTKVSHSLDNVLFPSDSHHEYNLNTYATLYLYVKSENHELVELYKDHIKKHNEKCEINCYM